MPDPRKRADLFEVARHSWLSEYHHVVSHITSSTTNIADIANSTISGKTIICSDVRAPVLTSNQDPLPEPPLMNRSASVREPTKSTPQPTPNAKLARTPEINNESEHSSGSKRERGPRHTLQAEYVPPHTHTTRGQHMTNVQAPVQMHERTISSSQVPPMTSKPLPQDPPRTQADTGRAPVAPQKMPPPTRPARDVPRSASDSTGAFAATSSAPAQQAQYTTRPSTQGSITSSGPTRSDLRLPSRGSYGQPVAPTVATTNAQGRVTQPTKPARGYNISGPMPQHSQQPSVGQLISQQVPNSSSPPPQQKGHHRRSSTLSGLGERLFGRSGSVRKKEDDRQKTGRKYPPTSMKPVNVDGEAPSRLSTESKRSFLGLGKKRSTDLESQHEKTGGRRFSLLPQSISFKGLMGGNKDQSGASTPQMQEQKSYGSRPPTGNTYPPQNVANHDGMYDDGRPAKYNNFSRPPQGQYRQAPPTQQNHDVYGGTGVYNPSDSYQQQAPAQNQFAPQYPDGFNEQPRPSMQQGRQGKGVLTKPNRKFAEAYDNEPGSHAGSSGAVKKVQDFFRRRGRARADSDYRY